MNYNKPQIWRIATAKIVAIYALFGLAWIYGSDTALGLLVQDPALLVKIAVIKGSLFILCTATLLYFLINRFAKRLTTAESSLIENLKNYLAIFNATNEAIFVHDARSGTILDVNDRMLEMFGYQRDEALSLDIGRLSEGSSPYSQLEAVEKMQKAMNEGPQVFEWHQRKKSGELFWVEVSLKRVHTGDFDRVISVARDISDRKKAEQEKGSLEAQLQQAQKMEAVGRLAGGVAHDFNNLLTVILGYSGLSLMEADPTSPLNEHLTSIQHAAEKSADLTQQLLAFARKQTITPEVLDLNKTLAGMVKMLKRLIGDDIDLKWLPDTNLWSIKADPSQLDQILANLCVNARDAITGVGTITIATGNRVLDESICTDHEVCVPGNYAWFSVSDNGSGMDKKTLAHIFEPFFTTKEAGKGTGLGLATVYGAVKQNNGFIDITSESGVGTTFTIYLPRYVGEDVAAGKENSEAPLPRGTETVLLVEDQTDILKMTSTFLCKLGYTVLSANSPGKAVQLAKESGGGILLLVTDVVMPEENGKELAEKLTSLFPGLKTIFMSGYTADVIASHGVLNEGIHFIKKPFSLPALASKIREVLDGN
jgi:PAS domain S-box-containing protein